MLKAMLLIWAMLKAMLLTKQYRCIAGPILGRVFETSELMFNNTANDSVKFEFVNDWKIQIRE